MMAIRNLITINLNQHIDSMAHVTLPGIHKALLVRVHPVITP